MTTASVYDVGMPQMGKVPYPASENTVQSNSGFKDVFRQQTGQVTDSCKEDSVYERPKNGSEIKLKNPDRRQNRFEGKAKGDQENEEDTVSATKEVAEKLLPELAAFLGITVDELAGMLENQQIQPKDLLQTDTLSEFLKTAGVEMDSVSLLTDENLYENYQQLLNRQKQFVEELAGRLQMTPQQVEELLEQLNDPRTDDGFAVSLGVGRQEESVLNEEDEPVKEPLKVTDKMPNAEELKERVQTQDGKEETDNGSKQDSEQLRQENAIDTSGILKSTVEATVESEIPTMTSQELDTQQLMRQIMDYMKVSVKPDMSSVEMQLHPASLGTLQVQVTNRNGILTAQFITQNEAVKTALESQLAALKDSFLQQGMKVEAVEVSVQTNSSWQNLAQDNSESKRQEQGKSRVRRTLNISDEAEGDTQDREVIETLGMMNTSGTTVDFTA